MKSFNFFLLFHLHPPRASLVFDLIVAPFTFNANLTLNFMFIVLSETLMRNNYKQERRNSHLWEWNNFLVVAPRLVSSCHTNSPSLPAYVDALQPFSLVPINTRTLPIYVRQFTQKGAVECVVERD